MNSLMPLRPNNSAAKAPMKTPTINVRTTLVTSRSLLVGAD
jgi:hypothetical protein